MGRTSKTATLARLRLLHRAVRRHLERKVEGRHVLVRMVRGISELRDAEIVQIRIAFRALIDARIKVDEVPPRRTGCGQENLHVALAVEGTSIAIIGVVIDDVGYVGRLGPTPPLDVNGDLRAD